MRGFFDLVGPAASLLPYARLLVQAFWLGVASAREASCERRAEEAEVSELRELFEGWAKERRADTDQAAAQLRRMLEERATRYREPT